MLKRIKNLFKSDSGNKPGNFDEQAEKSENGFASGGLDSDNSDFESMIVKAYEKYASEVKNGNNSAVIDPKITEIENNINIMMIRMYFQGRRPNLQCVLKNISNIIPQNDFETGDPISRAWDIFSYILFRSNLMRPHEVLNSVSTYSAFSDIPRDALTACTAESLAYIYTVNPDIGSAHLELILINQMMAGENQKNADLENQWLNDPNYGLVPGKPIFVKGFGPHREYLERLCTPDGEKLAYTRRGSMQVKGINGPVDVYDLNYPDGKKYITIYQCVYGTHNSNTAPRGLKLR